MKLLTMKLLLLFRFLSWKWWQQTVGSIGRSGPSASTATRTRPRRAAVAIRSPWTLSNSVGTGSSRRRSTKLTIAPGSALMSSCRNIRTRTLFSRPIRPVRPVRAVLRARCHPFPCSTLTTNSTSFMDFYLEWWSTDVVARRQRLFYPSGSHFFSLSSSLWLSLFFFFLLILFVFCFVFFLPREGKKKEEGEEGVKE